jgi:hypothetical protein
MLSLTVFKLLVGVVIGNLLSTVIVRSWDALVAAVARHRVEDDRG